MIARDEKLDPKRLEQKQKLVVVPAEKASRVICRHGSIRGSTSDVNTH